MIQSLFESDHPIISALVWTLIHSIWQFSVISLAMSVMLKLYQKEKSSKKYQIALGSMIFSFITAVVTFCLFYFDNHGQEVTIFINDIADFSSANDQKNNIILSIKSWIDQYQLPVFYTWMIGVALFAIRFIMSIAYVEFLSGTATPIYCQDTYKAFRRVCLHYKVKENITIGESIYVKSPMILGFLKPIILFPIGIINQLDITETEAILAHELAHFVRKDIYVNIIQNLMEALLFYHPAIWWISANIRLERESCCDNLAIGYMGDNIHYARTLVKMQEIFQNNNNPILAMNFSKQESFFSNRIKRILNMAQTRNYLKEKIITSIVLVAILMFITKDMTGTSEKSAQKIGISDQQKNEITIVVSDTLPNKKESLRIQKKTNDKEVKLSMEDGKVTELEIDGKKIDEKDFEQYTEIITELKPRSSSKGIGHMLFSDSDENDPFVFKFNHDFQMDSLMGAFDFKGFEHLKELNGLGFDHKLLDGKLKNLHGHLGHLRLREGDVFGFSEEKMEQLQKELGNLKELQGGDMERLRKEMGRLDELNGKGYGISKDKKEQLRKELGNLRFNFEGLDSMNFHFDKFPFPEFRKEHQGPDVKIYKYDGEGQNYNFDFDDNSKRFEFGKASENFSDAIGNSLNRDGLLIPGQENKVELTGKLLKINGEKQPNNIFQKYKRVFEETSGTVLEKNSKLQFKYKGKESKRKFKVY